MGGATPQQWNPELYQASHSWAWEYGRDLLQLLRARQGERVLDVGSGTGQLAHEIATSGADVVGIDVSPDMVAAASKNFPYLRFEVCDAAAMAFNNEFDAVFSNAVLHWVSDQDGAIGGIARSLKSGGRFVLEMGGYRNLEHVWESLKQSLRELGMDDPNELLPWTFPTVGKYATLLESHGFRVDFAVLFERPTPLEGGELGLANWLHMFGSFALGPLAPSERKQAIRRAEELARPKIFRDGRWIADYKRLRMLCVKQ